MFKGERNTLYLVLLNTLSCFLVFRLAYLSIKAGQLLA